MGEGVVHNRWTVHRRRRDRREEWTVRSERPFRRSRAVLCAVRSRPGHAIERRRRCDSP
ncbi:Hypothetical protein SCLAV_2329 [Streptomyces clavuligerus]|uniref:Uncharacterized protein n=1 Tax=Streptomyces clavuligerus TaxID=1901 RepID=E2Q7J6_STRCL|nr:Hypothetical protein SCLAV_2329 [Streptomyces clavuligerus]